MKEGRQIQRIIFDIMIFNGDVSFELRSDSEPNLSGNNKRLGEEKQVSTNTYYLSNKVYNYYFEDWMSGKD